MLYGTTVVTVVKCHVYIDTQTRTVSSFVILSSFQYLMVCLFFVCTSDAVTVLLAHEGV